MGYNKITNLLRKLDKDEIPKFTTTKWIEIFDQSNGTYPNKDIRFKTTQIRNDLCDFNDAYIVVNGKITAANPGNNINDYNKKVALKNSSPFFNCTLKINNQLIEDAQDLDIVMPMCNLLNYSKNFRKTTGSFWNYYTDKPKSGYNDDDARDKIFYSIRNSESFDYKSRLIDSLDDNLPPIPVTARSENIKFVVSLKNLSNFISNLDFLMINTEIELILTWSQNCVLTGNVRRNEINEGDDPALEPTVPPIDSPTILKFNITDCKLHVPIVTLQDKYENILYENLKTGIDIDFEWKRCRTQIINQPATNNLNFLIDPTFSNVNRLFVLAFPNEEDRSSFSKYYMLNIEIKDYNVVIDLQPFYDIPIKNK